MNRLLFRRPPRCCSRSRAWRSCSPCWRSSISAACRPVRCASGSAGPMSASVVLGSSAGAGSRARCSALAALLLLDGAGIGAYHVGVEQGWWALPAGCAAGTEAPEHRGPEAPAGRGAARLRPGRLHLPRPVARRLERGRRGRRWRPTPPPRRSASAGVPALTGRPRGRCDATDQAWRPIGACSGRGINQDQRLILIEPKRSDG